MSAPLHSPSSSSASTAISDLLASLSDSALSLQSSLPLPVAAEVLRQRDEQRKKIVSIIAHIKELTTPKDVSTTLNGVFIQSKPSFFIDLAYRFVKSDGLTFICDWFEAAFDANLRDIGDPSNSSSSPNTALIPPELTLELLHHLLRAWYRLSVYQQERSRAALANRPRLFTSLRSLVSHPNTEISELAVGLLVLYQPDAAAEVQGLMRSAAPSTASDASGASGSGGDGASVIQQIRAEFVLAREARQAEQRMLKAVEPLKPRKKKSSAINGVPHPPSSPSASHPPTLASPVPAKRSVEAATASIAIAHSPSSSLPIAANVGSPVFPVSPPSPAPTFTAAFASLSCPICGECFTTDLATYHHVSTVHYLWLCTLCCLAFPAEEVLYSHFESHNHAADSADAPHACGLCGVSFHTEDSLTLHHTIHTLERKAKQQYNVKRKRKPTSEDRGSPSKRSKKQDDDDEGGGDDDDGGGPNRFPPAICSHPSHPSPLCFSSDEDLQSHAVVAHLCYHCFAPECETQLNTAQLLADHLVKAHVMTSKDFVSGGPVPSHCQYCGVIWTKRTPKTEHLHRHEKPFHCPVCAMRFARRTRWRNHVKRKHPDDFKKHSAIFEGAKG